jgi:hypothetical protein
MGDRDSWASPTAAKALGCLGDPAAIPHLRATLRHGDPRVQDGAAEALARFGDPAGIDWLAQAVEDWADPWRAAWAAKALCRYAKGVAFDRLADVVSSDDPPRRLKELVAKGRPSRDDELGRMLSDVQAERQELRLTAARALAQRWDPTVLPALASALDSSDEQVQYAALVALAEPADLSALLHLRPLMDVGEETFCVAAVEGCSRLGDPAALQRLMDWVAREGVRDPLHWESEARPDMAKVVRWANILIDGWAVALRGGRLVELNSPAEQ